MTKKEIQLKRKLEHELRQREYLSDKHNYDVKACVVAGCLPVFIEYLEELNKIFPEHYSKEVIKVLNQNINSIFYKCPEDEKPEVAEQMNKITMAFESWIETNFKFAE
jgi:hypothetical protein